MLQYSVVAPRCIPYSGKFSLVQNFAESLVSALEEIFVVLIFARSLHARHYFAAYSKFRGSYFRGGPPIRENREILHHAKISRYTVLFMRDSGYSASFSLLPQ